MGYRPKLLFEWMACCLSMLVAGPAIVRAQTESPDEAARIEFFENKVRPVLAGNCYNCHSADTNSHGGLRVDDRNGLVVGGGRGPAVVPGDPEQSLLVQAIRQTHPQVKMPPDERLTDEQIADVTQWIKEGAAWPKATFEIPPPDPEYARLRAEHWAWQPLKRPAAPKVNDQAWPRGQIDRFILARLEAAGLQPVPDADPLTLIRRVTFDLTGRPPALDELNELGGAWDSPDRSVMFQKLVDRLLSSPGFGERWGRHWLDVARYGESTGSARNLPYPHAWRYRDYVIEAFNSDKPFDQFLCQQIAGDLLPAETQRQRDEHLIATGFLSLGVCDVNQRFKVRFVMDNVDEQIETVGRAVLGLSVGCARCHDHKFDPIPTTDYYALAGIFHSTDRCAALRNKMGGGGLDYYDTAMLLRLGAENPDPSVAEKTEQRKAALAAVHAALAAWQQAAGQAPTPESEKQIAAAKQQAAAIENELRDLNDPAVQGPVAMGVREGRIGDTEIRIRGEAEQLGPVVPRGVLSLLAVPSVPAIPRDRSGRLELAEWLTSEHNPLTPRVMANRIWQRLFGRGIVGTVDNFGVMGDVPSHPELLDYLAAQFIDQGWSVKKLVREIVLSRAYQLGSQATERELAADPANRLLWRHHPRRLDAEEIRDAMLAAAGELSLNRFPGSPAQDFKVVELPDNGAQAQRLEVQSLASKHRSVYLPLVRGLTPRPLAVFDFAEQGMVTGSRDTTTVATQALYLLNDPFVRQESQALAARVAGDTNFDDTNVGDSARINLVYQLSLSRPAAAHELERAMNYLSGYEAAAREQEGSADPRLEAWTSFCHAILASAEFRYLK